MFSRRHIIKGIFPIFLLFSAMPLAGQAPSEGLRAGPDEDVTLLYRKEQSFGALVHSAGFGASYRQGKHQTWYRKRIWEVEGVNMRHRKEIKDYKATNESAKGYYYGKLNSLFILRTGMGVQRALSRKLSVSGVEVQYLYCGGFSLGLLKPVYLRIAYSAPGGQTTLKTERYDPNLHTKDNIFEKAPFSIGLNETQPVPGLYGKAGISFEYAADEAKIRALEMGIIGDGFYYWRERDGALPLIADIVAGDSKSPNRPWFLTLYLSFRFGSKR